MGSLAYYNGKIDLLEKMKIPMTDRVCFFGDGIYDATYAIKNKIYAFDDHIARFYRSATGLGIRLPYGKEEMKEIIQSIVNEAGEESAFVYFQATRGTEARNHIYDFSLKANIWITVTPKEIVAFDKELKLISVKDTRHSHCDIKTLNLIPNVMASTLAKRRGADEAVFIWRGKVTECCHSNISILKGGVLFVPPAGKKVLAGVTRKKMLEICSNKGIEVKEKYFSYADLLLADEVIVSSAGQLALRAVSIDEKRVGGRDEKLYRTIQSALIKDFSEQTGYDK